MTTSNSGYNAEINSLSESNPPFSGFNLSKESRRSSNSSIPGSDPTSFLSHNFRKFDDLHRLLDNNKDSLKLEAMKRIIEMVARGQNCYELFASVVKNVVSKNTEVRKLVYVYLERYAEEQQDLALLSVSTFQKALKDPNQLIRSCALRVLSSIRVPMIAPIVMLAIKDCAQDMSPYVRRTVAHSIPKLFELDSAQKEQLIEVIEKLMKDQYTMVMGSAIVAFEQVCPERIQFLHENYRKLCNVLPDIDEWGQVFVLNLLTRYARTQFLNPNILDAVSKEDKFYTSSDSSTDFQLTKNLSSDILDHDHRLLLRASRTLLQSRNSAVVMSVAQLYYHLAPKNEISLVIRPLIRLLKSHREIRTIVLINIATISAKFSSLFEPFLKQFFITIDEPTLVKKVKLEILINLTNEVNAPIILREFSVYIYSDDFLFVSAAIHAIGRIANNINQMADICLSGLLNLLSSTDFSIVGESVIVIQRMLQMRPDQYKDIIVRLSKMVDKTNNSDAKASILWLIGEHCDKVPKIAPDVLRKAAKNFTDEPEAVKFQTINLASKLYIMNPKQTHKLCQYVFLLSKYDLNYDIRDRSRLLQHLIFPSSNNTLSKYAKKILFSTKPAPVLRSTYKDRELWQLGTMSHFLNCRVIGYLHLPEFPISIPDPSVRDVQTNYSDIFENNDNTKRKIANVDTNFYSSSSYSSSEYSGSSYESESDIENNSEIEQTKRSFSSVSSISSSSSNNLELISKSDDSSIEGLELCDKNHSLKKLDTVNSDQKSPIFSSNDKLLLFDDIIEEDIKYCNVLKPSTFDESCFNLSPGNPAQSGNVKTPCLVPIGPIFVEKNSKELVNKYVGKDVSINYRMLRRILFSRPKMLEIEILIENKKTSSFICDLVVSADKGTSFYVENEIGPIAPLKTYSFSIGIDFNDSLHPASLIFTSVDHQMKISTEIHPSMGDLILPIKITSASFLDQQKALGGMNMVMEEVNLNLSIENINKKILQLCNLNSIISLEENSIFYAGVTASNRVIVLVSLTKDHECRTILKVNCTDMVVSGMLFKDIKNIL